MVQTRLVESLCHLPPNSVNHVNGLEDCLLLTSIAKGRRAYGPGVFHCTLKLLMSLDRSEGIAFTAMSEIMVICSTRPPKPPIGRVEPAIVA